MNEDDRVSGKSSGHNSPQNGIISTIDRVTRQCGSDHSREQVKQTRSARDHTREMCRTIEGTNDPTLPCVERMSAQPEQAILSTLRTNRLRNERRGANTHVNNISDTSYQVLRLAQVLQVPPPKGSGTHLKTGQAEWTRGLPRILSPWIWCNGITAGGA